MRIYRRELPEYLTLRATENSGKSLTGASITIGLSLDRYTPPQDWLTPDVVERPSPDVARALYLIDSRVTTPGKFCAWVKVSDTPETIGRPVISTWIEIR